MELRGQGRSQMEFGNEEGMEFGNEEGKIAFLIRENLRNLRILFFHFYE